MPKIIYHIHDQVCKHASNKLEDIVSYALKYGYKELYFTEHPPISVTCDYQRRRATHVEIKKLVNKINKINKLYKGKLHIYFGYETEFNKPNRWYFERLARDPLPLFLISGNHFFGDLFKQKFPFVYTKWGTKGPKQFKELLSNFHDAMASGLFSWIPHPDIFLAGYKKWDKQAIDASKSIIKWAIKYKLPLGFNVNFKQEPKDPWHYPVKQFWQLVAKTNVPVIVEADSHDHHTITVEWLNKGKKMAIAYGLKKNLVDSIDINWSPKKPLMVLYEKNLYRYINKDIVKNLLNNKVKFAEINTTTKIKQLFNKNNIHPVWTIALVNNEELLKQLKKTACYIISNKQTDLTLKEFNKLTYKQLLKCFIKEP